MRNLNHIFSGQSHSAGPGELSIRFFFDENSSDARANVGGVVVGTRTKDSLWRRLLEFRARARRLALAGGVRLLRSFGIDRLDEPAPAAGRGAVDPDG